MTLVTEPPATADRPADSAVPADSVAALPSESASALLETAARHDAATTSAPPSSPSFPVSPSTSASPASLRRLNSPLGRIELVGNGAAVVSLTIERAGSLPLDALPEATDDVLEQAARELAEYFAGSRRRFDVPVALTGTAFQKAVWAELDRLEWGSVTSYGSVGRAIGRPTAGRAVGGAIGANPVPLLVGCHRVLAANHRITGYSAGEGIPTKAWLLDHEGISHR